MLAKIVVVWRDEREKTVFEKLSHTDTGVQLRLHAKFVEIVDSYGYAILHPIRDIAWIETSPIPQRRGW